jgi:hypothetical protein
MGHVATWIMEAISQPVVVQLCEAATGRREGAAVGRQPAATVGLVGMKGAAATVGRPAAAVTVVKTWWWALATTTDRPRETGGCCPWIGLQAELVGHPRPAKDNDRDQSHGRAMRCGDGGQATGSACLEPASAVACDPSGAVRVTDRVEARGLDVHGNRSKAYARRDDALGVDQPFCSGKLTARGRVQGGMRLAGVVVARMNPGPMTLPGDLQAR